MKPLLLKTLVVSCLMGLVAVGFAQNENKKKKAGPTTQLRGKVEASDLSAEIKGKITKIIDDADGKLKELSAKVEAVLTDEQKAARKAAKKAAKDAGKNNKEAAADVTAAMKLTDEQAKKMGEAQKELDAARAEMNKAIAALVTDEQAQSLGVKGKGKKKKNQ